VKALQLAKGSKPDIVIMAVQLPDTNAENLLGKLESISPSAKVYLCSAYPDKKNNNDDGTNQSEWIYFEIQSETGPCSHTAI